jgi:predicted nucleic acid-binding protein
MKRTFIDSGVLIAAARGQGEVALAAMNVLDDPDREFASSALIKLEVLPKPVYTRRQSEVDFYETFFAAVAVWAELAPTLVEEAYRDACSSGLSAMDALHIAAAASVNADEFVTSERSDRPIHRTKRVRVTSLIA